MNRRGIRKRMLAGSVITRVTSDFAFSRPKI
jgi:hypothetical protein